MEETLESLTNKMSTSLLGNEWKLIDRERRAIYKVITEAYNLGAKTLADKAKEKIQNRMTEVKDIMIVAILERSSEFIDESLNELNK